MRLSLQAKLYLVLSPLVAMLLFLFFALTSPYRELSEALRGLRSDIFQTVTAARFAALLLRQEHEYSSFILLGEDGTERHLEEAQEVARKTLSDWKTLIRLKEVERSKALGEVEKEYALVNQAGGRLALLVKEGDRDGAMGLMGVEIEPLIEGSLLPKVDSLIMEGEREVKGRILRLAGLTARLGLFASREIESEIERMGSNISQAVLAEQFARSFNQQIKEYSDLVLRGQSHEGHIADAKEKSQEIMDDWMAEIGAAGEEAEMSGMALFHRERVLLDEIGEEVIGLVKAGKGGVAADLIKTKLEPLVDSLSANLSDLSSEEVGEIDKGLLSMTNRATQMGLGVSVLGLVVLVAVVGSVWLLARSLVDPIVELKGAASRVGEGELETTVNVRSKDEVGELASAFNDMVASLARMTVSRDELAQYAQELEQSREALYKQNQILQSILESMSEGVVVADEGGKMLFFNPAAERIVGMGLTNASPDEWSGEYGLYLPDGGAMFPTDELPLVRAMGGEGSDHVEMLVRNRLVPEGVLISVAGRPLRDKNENLKGGVIVFRDITGRKRMEELRLAKEVAEHTSRAKSEFLSRMSHELRTPMNAVLGFAQLLEMDNLTPKQRGNVGHILKAGRHLLRLIDEVLDITRIEAGRLSISIEPLRMREVVEEVSDLVRPMAEGRGVVLQAERSAVGEDYVMADRGMLKQTLLNLLSNAVKYNRQGGRATVSCHKAAERRLRVLVSDTGPGIPEEKMERLFSPFDRLGAEQTGVEGTGLGLTITKRLVEAMGGSIGVESTVGQGSAFWVELPIAEGPNGGMYEGRNPKKRKNHDRG